MAFVKTFELERGKAVNKIPVVGDTVKTTVKHSSFVGYFEEGTTVKVIGISNRGYDIEDEEGNKILEIGWVI